MRADVQTRFQLSIVSICLLVAGSEALPTPISPLQSTAQAMRLEADATTTEYCEAVADSSLPIFDTQLTPAEKCQKFANQLISTTSLSTMPTDQAGESATLGDLKEAWMEVRQLNHSLVQLMQVITDSLLQDCPGTQQCQLICLSQRQPEMDLLCRVEKYLLADVANFLISLYEEIEGTANQTTHTGDVLDIDVTSNDSDVTIRYYSVIVMEYTAKLTTVVKKVIDLYEQQ